MTEFQILPMKKQDEIITNILRQRLDTILPLAMRKGEIDMWLILCQEDDLDPVFKTMLPLNTWTPILQMLIFYDRGEHDGIEKINLSMTDTSDLYDKPWTGKHHEEQWRLLSEIIQERDPKRIGINIGSINWAAGGLTYNLYQQLKKAIPQQYVERLVSAERACTRWLMTLSSQELEIYPSIVALAHQMIRHCFSRSAIMPGVTTTDDLEWFYWQLSVDLGLGLAFKPYFRIYRSESQKQFYGSDDKTIRHGDVVHCDVGIRYLRLCTDHQELAYVLQESEMDVPAGLKNILAENNRLQKIYMGEFKQGLSGNQILENILARAKAEGIPSPKVYSHSLGLYLHEPGPLIGLPWEQVSCPGRGDMKLEYNNCFTMELSVEDRIPEWGNQIVRLGTEQDVKFTEEGCIPMDGVQTTYHLV